MLQSPRRAKEAIARSFLTRGSQRFWFPERSAAVLLQNGNKTAAKTEREYATSPWPPRDSCHRVVSFAFNFFAKRLVPCHPSRTSFFIFFSSVQQKNNKKYFVFVHPLALAYAAGFDVWWFFLFVTVANLYLSSLVVGCFRFVAAEFFAHHPRSWEKKTRFDFFPVCRDVCCPPVMIWSAIP